MKTALAQTGTLQQRTLQLLKQNKYTPLQIYDGTGVKPDWIKQFKKGGMPHPSVNRVQKVYEFLSGKPLVI